MENEKVLKVFGTINVYSAEEMRILLQANDWKTAINQIYELCKMTQKEYNFNVNADHIKKIINYIDGLSCRG